MPLAILAAVLMAPSSFATRWETFYLPKSKDRYSSALRVMAPVMKVNSKFEVEGAPSYPRGREGIYSYDEPGFRIRIASVPTALAQAFPESVKTFREAAIGLSPTKRGELTIVRSSVTYPAADGVPEDKSLRQIAVVRLTPQPIVIEVAASPERWESAEAVVKSIFIEGELLRNEEIIHPLWFKGRTLPPPDEGKSLVPAFRPGGFTYEYPSTISSLFQKWVGTCRLDVDDATELTVEAPKRLFKSVELEEGLRFGLGATWLHLRGTGVDGRPTEVMASRFGGKNVVARISLPAGVALPSSGPFTGATGNEVAFKEPVGAGMFLRNIIVSRQSVGWGKGDEFRVDSLPLTLSGPTATFSVNDRIELTGTATRAVEPFGEREFGILENEFKLDSTTYVLHAVRADGFEPYVFDSIGPVGRPHISYVMQRPQPPALTVRMSNDYAFAIPFFSSMEVADPAKGWVPWGWPGDGLPKGFAYYWTKGRPIRDGLWVVSYPAGWRVNNPPKDLLWGPDGTGYGISRFDIEYGKLFVYGLPTGYKLDDKKVERRLKAWAELTGSTLSSSGRWEKVTARGKAYDVYKTSATRDGVERDVWHYRGPKPDVGEDTHTFLLECKPSDAAARDAWLKLNEVPPPPMRRAAPF